MKKQVLSFCLALLLLSQSAPLSIGATSSDSSPDTVGDTAGKQTQASPSTDSADPPASSVAENGSYSKQISEAGLEVIKSFEGFYPYPYWDYQQYSFGYGSRCDASTVYKDKNSPTGYSTTLYPNGIPEREASKLLKKMIDEFAIKLNNFLEKYEITLNQNQFDALMSFSYNLGPNVWSNTNHALRNAILSGDYTQQSLTEIFGRYCHAGGERLEGLYQRRMREAAIFFSPYDMSDPNADLYVVNSSSRVYIRAKTSTASESKGRVDPTTVIRVHEYSSDGKWAFTSYCGYFGWVEMKYLVSIHEDAMVGNADENCRDGQGLTYTFDPVTMTATLGGSGDTNSSGYNGAYAGDVYLTPYILHNDAIYELTAIADTAFTGCQKIETIYIPSSVTKIGENAFADSSLDIIYYSDGSTAEEYAKNSIYTATDLRCKDGHTETQWTVIKSGSSKEPHTEEMACAICGAKTLRYHTGISILSYPTKTEYKLGNAFKADGLRLQAIYSDGTKVLINDYTLSGYDPDQLGTQTITVTHCLFSTSFTVEVSERKLTGLIIAVKPKKTTYIEGQDIVYDGLSVKAKYDDDTTQVITEYEKSGYDKNKIGKQTITISYNNVTTTFSVTVKAKTLTKLQILDYPYTMEYFCGETFDPDGLRLKLTYDNGTTEIVESDFKISKYDSSVPGKQEITVTCGKKTVSFRITFILNYLLTDSLELKDGYIQPIEAGMTVGELKKQFEAGDRIEILRDGHVLPDDSIVATNCTVRLIYNGSVQDSAILLVLGDLSGDGKHGFTDYLMIADYLMDRLEFTPQELSIADLNADGEITLTDYYALYLLTQIESPADKV